MKKIFKNKTILITGGTGFLGRALVRRILKYDPHAIRIFSRDEVKHYKVKEMIPDPKKKLRFFVGDVRDYTRLKEAMKECDIVIHAAAMKRIDMIEYNVAESIKTNILGSLNIVEACLENNIEKVIYVSTDKACSPINTYGSCKFVSERIFAESNFSKGKARTVFASVRYGNVLNSTGSIVEIIKNKIKNNQEIPLTDERMTRFFIGSEKAVDLIFNAIKYAKGGEVFVPKLCSFRIIDLIDILKKHYNYDCKVKVIGIRPGEKLHELMVNKSEASRTFEFGNILVIVSQIERYDNFSKYNYLHIKKLVKFKEYCSKDTLVGKDKIFEILKKCKLLN